ncbi:hypothetical protein [Tenacibaculum caenipelagi]|uniref:Uncharacterized protein n=1 Tax=Tenacibaculum caenipelagi TaxID=1325435 RepID=A0A4R6TM52_9FLAO|nr:hypothetical protein [Tenacibaculum caenipelagi]TDQ30130.1 hypothetical protein DFQ07_0467 [Tenacibaculum caenipelagi]
MKKIILLLTFFITITVNSQSKSEVETMAIKHAESGLSLMNDYSQSLNITLFGYYDEAFRKRKQELTNKSSESANSSSKPSSISSSGDNEGLIDGGSTLDKLLDELIEELEDVFN